jgi:hypothetical protein
MICDVGYSVGTIAPEKCRAMISGKPSMRVIILPLSMMFVSRDKIGLKFIELLSKYLIRLDHAVRQRASKFCCQLEAEPFLFNCVFSMRVDLRKEAGASGKLDLSPERRINMSTSLTC